MRVYRIGLKVNHQSQGYPLYKVGAIGGDILSYNVARHAECRDVSIKSGIRNWAEMAEMWMGQFGQTQHRSGDKCGSREAVAQTIINSFYIVSHLLKVK